MSSGADTSALGGSASSQADDREVERRWAPREGATRALRVVAFVLPFVAGYAAGGLTAAALPSPAGWWETSAWWLLVMASSSLAVWGGRRLARRLTPVALLLKMSLVFPDNAPSRYRMALKQSSARTLARRVAAGASLGSTPAEAAENILVLLTALNDHDRLTRGHSERVRAYADLIAEEMKLPAADREKLHWAALVHDVGKLSVPGEVLRKDGRPTDEEWQQLRGHPGASAKMLAPLYPWLGSWLSAATQHHERWDGAGYPLGLAGSDISIAGRIVAVADAYDTMTSARSYKKAWTAEQARAELVACAGTQFDPDVVRAFLNVSLGTAGKGAGVLAWAAQLPRLAELVGTAGSATGNVAVRVGTVAATSAVAAPAAVATAPAVFDVPDPAPVALALDAETETTILPSTTTSSTVVVTVSVAPTPSPEPVEQSTTTQRPPATEPTTSTTRPTTTTMRASTTTRAPTTTTTRPTTTTTRAPTTTTAPPTTTTTAPTTTTTTAPGTVLVSSAADNRLVIEAPTNAVGLDTHEADGVVQVWLEAQAVLLDEDVEAHLPTAAWTEVPSIPTVTISEDTRVCSVFIHVDDTPWWSTITATVEFDHPVLGVLRGEELSDTDYLSPNPDNTDYNDMGASDKLRLTSPTVLEIEAGMNLDYDQVRVLTAC